MPQEKPHDDGNSVEASRSILLSQLSNESLDSPRYKEIIKDLSRLNHPAKSIEKGINHELKDAKKELRKLQDQWNEVM